MSEETNILDDLENVEEISPEQILSQLFNPKKKRYHTEIQNPQAISTLDLMVSYFDDIGIREILGKYLAYFRVNMISFQRKRATEIVEAYKAKAQYEGERSRREVRDVLLGT